MIISSQPLPQIHPPRSKPHRAAAFNRRGHWYHLTTTFCLGLCFCVMVSAASARQSGPQVPELRRYVTDQTGTLSHQQLQSLESRLTDFERETSNQIVVLVVGSIPDGNIEEYALAVAEKNRIGRKSRDNGILLLVAKDDRRMRIEVGYGLEGALPDAIADQIIRHIITPRFREGDYATGIDEGVNAIAQATKGEFKGIPGREKPSDGIPIWLIFLLFFLLVGILPRLIGRRRSYYVGPGRYHQRGGWWGGGFGGGGFGGGGFGGGGGFSGGGGSFGGGGASGRW